MCACGCADIDMHTSYELLLQLSYLGNILLHLRWLPPPLLDLGGVDQLVVDQRILNLNVLPQSQTLASKISFVYIAETTRLLADGHLTRWPPCSPTLDPQNTNLWPTPTGPAST